MSTLVFPSEEALQLALTSGLVPSEVQSSPARYHRTAEGVLHVSPDAALTRAAIPGVPRCVRPGRDDLHPVEELPDFHAGTARGVARRHRP